MTETIRITRAQLDSLDRIRREYPSASMAMTLEQTRTETGGTHLYVRYGAKNFHVAAKSGNVVELTE
jgi:hypothetical protein